MGLNQRRTNEKLHLHEPVTGGLLVRLHHDALRSSRMEPSPTFAHGTSASYGLATQPEEPIATTT